MSHWMESEWVTQFGWVLLHSFWQFLLVTAAIILLQRAFFRFSAIGQYRLMCSGLLLIAVCPLATWYYLQTHSTFIGVAQPAVKFDQQSESVAPYQSTEVEAVAEKEKNFVSVKLAKAATAGAVPLRTNRPWWTRPNLSWLSLVWLVGVVLFSVRPIVGLWGQRQLRRKHNRDVSADLLGILAKAARRVGVRQKVSLYQSNMHVGPMVAGWLRPFIVIPASMATSMSPQEIELLLAHELAHVRRNDCLVNYLQVLAETVFFYHPAVWWISRQIRVAREHCCDDLAATDNTSRLNLGRALLALEQNRSQTPSFTLSATDGDLLNRVRRLSSGEHHPTAISFRLVASVLLLLSVSSLSWALPVANPQEQNQTTRQTKEAEPNDLQHAIQDDEPESPQVGLNKTPTTRLPAIHDKHDYWDLTLEECIAIALQNADFVVKARGTPGAENHQQNSENEKARRSAGGRKATARIPLVVTKRSRDMSLIDFEIQTRNLVRDVQNGYWDLFAAYRSVYTNMLARDQAQSTALLARQQLQGGAGTKQEVAQAEAQYYQFRGRLGAALDGSTLVSEDSSGVYGREKAMRKLLGLAATDGRLIRPIQEPSHSQVTFDWEASIKQLLQNNVHLRRQTLEVKQRTLELKKAREISLPAIEISQLYRWTGEDGLYAPGQHESNKAAGGVPKDEKASEANPAQQQRRNKTRGANDTIEFGVPSIGSRSEAARVRNAQLRLTRAKSHLQEQERMMVSQLGDAIATLNTRHRLLETNRQRLIASEAEVQARLPEYEGGRSPVNVLLQSQQRRAIAQITYHQTLSEYNKSVGYVQYLIGTLLSNNNIVIHGSN